MPPFHCLGASSFLSCGCLHLLTCSSSAGAGGGGVPRCFWCPSRSQGCCASSGSLVLTSRGDHHTPRLYRQWLQGVLLREGTTSQQIGSWGGSLVHQWLASFIQWCWLGVLHLVFMGVLRQRPSRLPCVPCLCRHFMVMWRGFIRVCAKHLLCPTRSCIHHCGRLQRSGPQLVHRHYSG